MKFAIHRVSLWDEKKSPLKGAKKEKCLRKDERTFKSPKVMGKGTE